MPVRQICLAASVACDDHNCVSQYPLVKSRLRSLSLSVCFSKSRHPLPLSLPSHFPYTQAFQRNLAPKSRLIHQSKMGFQCQSRWANTSGFNNQSSNKFPWHLKICQFGSSDSVQSASEWQCLDLFHPEVLVTNWASQ